MGRLKLRDEKATYSFVDKFELKDAWLKAGYNPTVKECARILGLSYPTYQNRIEGRYNIPIDMYIEIAIRCDMDKDQFIKVFFGTMFNEDGSLNVSQARRVYENRRKFFGYDKVRREKMKEKKK